MASITRDPYDRSPYWTACFTGFAGAARLQLKKSTATPERKLAQRIADELEEAAQGKRTTDQIKTFLVGITTDLRAQRAAHKAFDNVLRKTTGSGLGSKTTRGYITEWLEANQGTLAPATFTKYQKIAERLFTFLGGKADQDMAAVQADDVARFRNAEAKRVSKSTAHGTLKVTRVFFAAAERDAVIPRNVARLVRKDGDRKAKRARRAFKLPELKRVLAKCDDEWRSLVTFGLYTGARLGDLATLTWQAVDLENGSINFITRKTEHTISLPIAAPLAEHLGKLPAGDDPKAPLHPRAFAIVKEHGRVGTLSNQFHDILVDAGLATERTHQAVKGGPGRGGKRAAGELSFHSLRHTAVSLLKNAGVSDAVARDIVGHESAAVNALYTHIDDETKRRALNTLPALE